MLGNIGQKAKEKYDAVKAMSQIKKDLEQIFHSEVKRDIKVVVRGDKRIEKIEVGDEDLKELKDTINAAFKAVEKKAQKQMKGKLGGMGIPGL